MFVRSWVEMISHGNINDRVDNQQYPKIDMRHSAIVNQVDKLKMFFCPAPFSCSTRSIYTICSPTAFLQHAGLEKGHDCDAKRRGRSLLGILAGASLGFSRSVFVSGLRKVC